MTLQLIPLGTNGFYPSQGRQTMCFLLRNPRTPKQALLLDAGSGLGRLFTGELEFELGEDPLEEVERLEIFLSHYHLDHVVGLATLSHAWSRELIVHAPTEPLVDTDGEDPQDILTRILSPPLFPVAFGDFASHPDVRPYNDTSELELLGFPCTLRRQIHPQGSVGLRIGDAIAYVTDTAADEETIQLARGVSLLIHELWVTDVEGQANPRMLTGHSQISDVARLATAAQVGALAPVHHQPRRSEEEIEDILQTVAEAAQVPVVYAREGVPLPIDSMEPN